MKKLPAILLVCSSLLMVFCDRTQQFQTEQAATTVSVPDMDLKTNVYIETEISKLEKLATEEVLLAAITANNIKYKTLTNDEINQLDLKWRENASEDYPPFQEIHENECSRHLIDFTYNNPEILELFVMDNRGLLVASILLTSDYNQGDEKKFSAVFGKQTPWVDKLSYDESTKIHGVPVAVPVKDIGAIYALISLKNRYTAH